VNAGGKAAPKEKTSNAKNSGKPGKQASGKVPPAPPGKQAAGAEPPAPPPENFESAKGPSFIQHGSQRMDFGTQADGSQGKMEIDESETKQ